MQKLNEAREARGESQLEFESIVKEAEAQQQEVLKPLAQLKDKAITLTVGQYKVELGKVIQAKVSQTKDGKPLYILRDSFALDTIADIDGFDLACKVSVVLRKHKAINGKVIRL